MTANDDGPSVEPNETPGLLFLFLFRRGEGIDGWVVFALSVGAGLAHALAVILLGRGAELLGRDPLPWVSAAGFGAALVLYLATLAVSQTRGQRFIEQVMEEATLKVAERIPDSELITIERLGSRALIDTLTRNAGVVGDGAHAALGIVYAASQIIGMIGTLCVIAPGVAGLVIAVGGLGVVVLQRISRASNRHLAEAAVAEARFAGLARHLVEGFREVQSNRRRRLDLVHGYLMPAAADVSMRRRLVAWSTAKISGASLAQFYLVSFAAVFLAADLGFGDTVALGAFLAALSFDATLTIVAYLPITAEARQALQRLDAMATALQPVSLEPQDASVATARPFAELQFRGVRFSYPRAEARMAAGAVGPFDFTLRPGEIVFVTGGNGSGKSTFLKLLAGLYVPSAGDILVDGSVWHGNDYRRLFSTVFTDFYLFDMLAQSSDLDHRRAEALLHVFGLDGKVALTATGFTTTRLSTGQRKRLALIQAMLEDRPILLLDEWTADQDPEFRAVFFDSVLPDLKRQGRTIVAVTHDDRYFHCCDRLVRLSDGHIEDRQSGEIPPGMPADPIG